MLDGFAYLFSQVALVLMVGVLLGFVIGRYGRPTRRGSAATGPGSYVEARLVHAQARMTELEARINESESMLRATRRQLGQADVELVRMRMQVQELEDRKEAEMGRLESGAITALESTMATHREQVAMLEERLRAAETAADEHARELAVERQRSTQLSSALAERGQHIATLTGERVTSPDQR